LVTKSAIVNRFIKGSRKTGIVAITSRCNCRCRTCNIYENKPVDISFHDVTKILDFMAANKFLITYFTGGEPSLHPDLVRIVDYADKLGLVTSLTTNGSISSQTLHALKEAGLYAVSISVDSWDPAFADEHRRHSKIGQKQQKAFQTAQMLGIRTYGMTYLGTHLDPENIEKMVAHVNFALDAPFGFCYPVTSKESTYRLGQSASLHSMETMDRMIERLLELKKKGYRIINMTSYMEDALRFHHGQAPRFPCRGGEYVFYVDWFGDVYPCFMKKKLFNILKDDEPILPTSVACNDCLIECFREPSLLAYLSSPQLVFKEIAHGSPIKETILWSR
jgi:MoaA/NifB/PqqE/SkfB family radical SAM enzyme